MIKSQPESLSCPPSKPIPAFLKGGGHLPRMVEGRGSDPGPFEEPGDLGKEIELLVGHAGGDEKSHPLSFRGKTLEAIRRRLHGSFPFHCLFLAAGRQIGPGQPGRVVMKIIPEPAPDAQRGMVGRQIGLAEDFGDDVAFRHVQRQPAAESAMGTGGIGPFALPGPAFDGAQVFRQRPHGTQGEALSAGDAVAGVGRGDPGGKALSRDVDGGPPRDLAAGAVTPSAEDAPQFPVPDEGRGISAFRIFTEGLVFDPFDPVFIDEVLETAFPALVALGTIQGVGDEDELQKSPASSGRASPTGW